MDPNSQSQPGVPSDIGNQADLKDNTGAVGMNSFDYLANTGRKDMGVATPSGVMSDVEKNRYTQTVGTVQRNLSIITEQVTIYQGQIGELRRELSGLKAQWNSLIELYKKAKHDLLQEKTQRGNRPGGKEGRNFLFQINNVKSDYARKKEHLKSELQKGKKMASDDLNKVVREIENQKRKVLADLDVRMRYVRTKFQQEQNRMKSSGMDSSQINERLKWSSNLMRDSASGMKRGFRRKQFSGGSAVNMTVSTERREEENNLKMEYDQKKRMAESAYKNNISRMEANYQQRMSMLEKEQKDRIDEIEKMKKEDMMAGRQGGTFGEENLVNKEKILDQNYNKKKMENERQQMDIIKKVSELREMIADLKKKQGQLSVDKRKITSAAIDQGFYGNYKGATDSSGGANADMGVAPNPAQEFRDNSGLANAG